MSSLHAVRNGPTPALTMMCIARRTCAWLIALVLACLCGGQAQAASPLIDAEQVSAGGFHTCAIQRGSAICWGWNRYGQLGNNDTLDSTTPVAVIGLSSGVTAIGSGGAHTCAIVNGSVKCWGRNLDGELGNGSTTDSKTPVDVIGINGAVALSAGSYHTCALLQDDSVRCWGLNVNGQLGDGTTQSTDAGAPTTPSNLGSGVAMLALGGQHSCALVGGRVKCWGYNNDGELGDGATSDSHVPIAVVGLPTGVTSITAGAYHTCALDGATARCWGYNTNGQLGDGTTTSTRAAPPVTVSGLAGATQVVAGGAHTCAVVGGGAQCWGYNFFGQLGNATMVDAHLPVAVATLATGVTRMSTGGAHSCAQIDVGGQNQVRCWGDNIDGEIGLGDVMLQSTPSLVLGLPPGATTLTASAVAFHSCAIVGGGAWCWGDNANGQLGDGTFVDRSTAVAVQGLSAGVSAIVGGGSHTCAVVNGSAMCWGFNAYGQVGNGSNDDVTTPVVVISAGVSAVAAGAYHSCAIVNGGVECWGVDVDGELGDGTTNSSNVPVAVIGLSAPAVAIAAGVYHTCAALNTGKIQCWGDNSNGQLGDGTTTSTGANPPVTVLNIASGATALAGGGYHTCAIVDGGAQCWGEGDIGALGNGEEVDSAIPVNVVGFPSGVDAIVAGNSYSCLISAGNGYCWGNAVNLGGTNDEVLDVPVLLVPNVSSIGTAYEHGCGIISGVVACVGFDHYGQVGAGRSVFLESPGVVVQDDEIFRDGFDG